MFIILSRYNVYIIYIYIYIYYFCFNIYFVSDFFVDLISDFLDLYANNQPHIYNKNQLYDPHLKPNILHHLRITQEFIDKILALIVHTKVISNMCIDGLGKLSKKSEILADD